MNHALHIVAVTQIRYLHSPGRTFSMTANATKVIPPSPRSAP